MIGANADRHEFDYDHSMFKLWSFWSHQDLGRYIKVSHNMRFPTMWKSTTSKAPDMSAHTCSLIRAFASCLNIP